MPKKSVDYLLFTSVEKRRGKGMRGMSALKSVVRFLGDLLVVALFVFLAWVWIASTPCQVSAEAEKEGVQKCK